MYCMYGATGMQPLCYEKTSEIANARCLIIEHGMHLRVSKCIIILRHGRPELLIPRQTSSDVIVDVKLSRMLSVSFKASVFFLPWTFSGVSLAVTDGVRVSSSPDV